MKQYLDLLQHIIDTGAFKEDRTGTGTKSVFGYQMRFDLQEGFPVLTTKKLHLRSIIYELLWFLKGDTNIKLIVGGQAYKNNQAITLDVPAKLVAGRTLVPLRFVSEALGASVSWNSGVVIITSKAIPKASSTSNGVGAVVQTGQSAYQQYTVVNLS